MHQEPPSSSRRDLRLGDIPRLFGRESEIHEALTSSAGSPQFLPESRLDMGRLRSGAAVALHMHQPLLPGGGDDLRTARIIGNLEYMGYRPNAGDNHNAPVFYECYRRMAEVVPDLLRQGTAPRIMLEYSGTLLYALSGMKGGDVIEALRALTNDRTSRRAVEWLGCPWGHAVAPSTPPQDYRMHVSAWQHHFAQLFGMDALARVRGFSPSEMALPNHPTVAYEFVKTLQECGFRWVLVQEHTVEDPDTGRGPTDKHLPHRLVCRSHTGEEASIVAIIKTQGSDTKLVGQMQPYYEAKALSRCALGGKTIPQLVAQIADGENGGVMMNEFLPKYRDVVREGSGAEVALVNVSEYLEYLETVGIREGDLPLLQPVHQKPIWDRFVPGDGPAKLEAVIEEERRKDSRFHVEGGSWTNDVSWVRGYENVLGPMQQASSLFHERLGGSFSVHAAQDPARLNEALFLLLCSQTSCYRYWGQGPWTSFGREISRRAIETILSLR